MKASFSESTEAITHDSDPKLLNFQRISTNPTYGTGEGLVVENIGVTLPLDTLETGDIPASPALFGPRLSELTGGNSGPDKNNVTLTAEPPIRNSSLLVGSTASVTFADISDGQITFTFYDNLAETQTEVVTAAELRALAAAQGKSALSDAWIDLTGRTLFRAGLYATRASAIVDTDFRVISSIDLVASNCGGVTFKDAGSPVTDGVVEFAPGMPLSAGSTQPITATAPTYACLADSYISIHITLVGTTIPAGTIELTLHLDDASTIGPLAITTTQLQALAAAQGTLWNTAITILSTDLGWNLSALAGRTIVSVDWAITSPYVSTDDLLGPDSKFYLMYGSEHASSGSLASIGTTNTVVTFDGWGAGVPVFGINGTWFSDSSTYAPLQIDVDAVSVLAHATTPQLALQSTGVIFTSGTVATFLDTHIGWYLKHSAEGTIMLYDYGPNGMLPPSAFRIAIKSGTDEAPVYDVVSSFNPRDVAATFVDGVTRTEILSSSKIEFRVSMFPGDVPGVPATYGSIVVTEPYEVRHRNLPLFKLSISGSFTMPTPPVTFGVIMWGSQGQADNILGREWCPIKVNSLNRQGVTEQVETSVSVSQRVAPLPQGFSGTVIYPDKTAIGPWNYVRFSFLIDDEGKFNADYAGMQLNITANAREV